MLFKYKIKDWLFEPLYLLLTGANSYIKPKKGMFKERS